MKPSRSRLFLAACWLAVSLTMIVAARAQSPTPVEMNDALKAARQLGYDEGYKAGLAAGRAEGSGGFRGGVSATTSISTTKQGGGTRGGKAFTFDARTLKWNAALENAGTVKPAAATLEEMKTEFAKEGTTDSTVVIEGFPIGELQKLQDTVKAMQEARVLVAPGNKSGAMPAKK